ncbi:MAG: hypothetical protein RI897_4167 [Verrucomicrobiota bacterium]|jgi:hypothetical protein
MSFLPVVERELRVAARMSSTRWVRVLAAGAAVLVLGFALVVFSAMGMRGGEVFRFASVLLWLYALGSGPWLAADSISSERREGTLGLLFLTSLRGYDVVSGVLVARGLTAFYGWLGALPVVGVTILMGGVSWGEFWRVAGVTGATLFLSMALGVWLSCMVREQFAGLVWSVGLLLALVFAGLVLGYGGVAGVGPGEGFRGSFDSVYGGDAVVYWRGLVSTVGLGLVALAGASLVLGRNWRMERVGRAGVRRRERSRQGAGALGDADPVEWLVRRTGLMSRRRLWGWTLVFCLAGALFPVVQARAFSPGGMVFMPFLGWIGGVWVQVVMIFQASRFLVEARKSGALELLMSTALSPQEVVDGQVRALTALFRGPVLLLLGMMLFPFVLQWGLIFFGRESWEIGLMEGGVMLVMGAYRALAFVVGVYAGGWLSLAMSAGSKRPERAPYMVTLYLVVLPVVLFCVPSLVIYLLALFYARNQMRRNFVQLTRRPYGRGLSGRR